MKKFIWIFIYNFLYASVILSPPNTPTLIYDNNQTKYTPSIFNEFNIGIGDRMSWEFKAQNGGSVWVNSVDLMLDTNIENNGYYQQIENSSEVLAKFKEIQSYLTNAKFLVLWITKGWSESYFDVNKIQQAIDNGIIPIFLYWYFGDSIVNDNAINLINSDLTNYQNDNIKVGNFLKNFKGSIFFIMEPEFNKPKIIESNATQEWFGNIINDSINTIKSYAGNEVNLYFSICPTDAGSRNYDTNLKGYERDSLGDKIEWSKFFKTIETLKDNIDFISFQEMVGQFSRNPLNPEANISYSDSEMGIYDLSERIQNFSKFLNKNFNLPIFLPYVTIPTASWSDENLNGAIEDYEVNSSGWIDRAEFVYSKLVENIDSLHKSGLFGFAPMLLFDDPKHDLGGYQYFKQNEYYLGLLETNAIYGTNTPLESNITYKGTIFKTIFEKKLTLSSEENTTIPIPTPTPISTPMPTIETNINEVVIINEPIVNSYYLQDTSINLNANFEIKNKSINLKPSIALEKNISAKVEFLNEKIETTIVSNDSVTQIILPKSGVSINAMDGINQNLKIDNKTFDITAFLNGEVKINLNKITNFNLLRDTKVRVSKKGELNIVNKIENIKVEFNSNSEKFLITTPSENFKFSFPNNSIQKDIKILKEYIQGDFKIDSKFNIEDSNLRGVDSIYITPTSNWQKFQEKIYFNGKRVIKLLTRSANITINGKSFPMERDKEYTLKLKNFDELNLNGVTNRWKLLGSTNDIDKSKFENFEVWIYRDGVWIKNPKIIYKSEGFWIKKD